MGGWVGTLRNEYIILLAFTLQSNNKKLYMETKSVCAIKLVIPGYKYDETKKRTKKIANEKFHN
jgi:hypothetical protein